VSEVYDCQGTPTDGDEMVDLQWFSTRALPLGEMLPGDSSWIKQALGGERFYARVYYSPNFGPLERETEIVPLLQEELNRLWDAP
jgi:hypothetical protein